MTPLAPNGAGQASPDGARATQFKQVTPGHTSIVVRLYGPVAVMGWFQSLDPRQRAEVVARQREMGEQKEKP